MAIGSGRDGHPPAVLDEAAVVTLSFVEERRATGSRPSVSAGGSEEGMPRRSRFRRSAMREEKMPSRKRDAWREN
jgi:hypothetical protein